MKTSKTFQTTIATYLEKIAMQDPVFKKKFENPKKKIEDCVTYILNTVKKSGVNGFTDSEIYGMALHYYDEEIINIGSPMKMKVVVNHKVELTPEEIEAEKKKARDKIHAEIRENMVKPKKKKKVEPKKEEKSDGPLTLF